MKEAADLVGYEQKNDSTPDEPWTVRRPSAHWYNAMADYVLESLGDGADQRCLVVGSPVFEALDLQDHGWRVTYVDVRQPPLECGLQSVLTVDAANYDLGSEVFDACSSTCVLCHAGLGRYGDEIEGRADQKILDNIHRALKPGAPCIITFGPVYRFEETMRVSNTHRVYSVEDVDRMTSRFKVLEAKIYDTLKNEWVPHINTDKIFDSDYLTVRMAKP